MKLKTLISLFFTHTLVAIVGFGAGIYALPILTEPTAPTQAAIKLASTSEMYQASFQRDLKDSDALHWGEGEVSIGANAITFVGELAPGPDYRLYLSPTFVETEADFKKLKSSMVNVGGIATFTNFIVDVPANIDVKKYNTVIVWCESFNQFITAAQYQ